MVVRQARQKKTPARATTRRQDNADFLHLHLAMAFVLIQIPISEIVVDVLKHVTLISNAPEAHVQVI